MKQPCFYILCSKKDGILYIGVTSNIIQRMLQHRAKSIKGFASLYHCTKLVYYEIYPDMMSAIRREKAVKEWKRKWKVEMIAKENPDWNDLFKSLIA